MTFPALDLVSLAARIHGVPAPAVSLGYSGGSIISYSTTTAIAGVEFRTNGTVGRTSVTQGLYRGDSVWVSGTFNPADYEIKATMVSGTTSPTGDIPFGSFVALSSVRELSISRSSPGTDTATFDIEIREIATPANTTTGRVSLTVEQSI